MKRLILHGVAAVVTFALGGFAVSIVDEYHDQQLACARRDAIYDAMVDIMPDELTDALVAANQNPPPDVAERARAFRGDLSNRLAARLSVLEPNNC